MTTSLAPSTTRHRCDCRWRTACAGARRARRCGRRARSARSAGATSPRSTARYRPAGGAQAAPWWPRRTGRVPGQLQGCQAPPRGSPRTPVRGAARRPPTCAGHGTGGVASGDEGGPGGRRAVHLARGGHRRHDSAAARVPDRGGASEGRVGAGRARPSTSTRRGCAERLGVPCWLRSGRPRRSDAHEDAELRGEEARAEARVRLTMHDNLDGTVTGHFTVPTLAGADPAQDDPADGFPSTRRTGRSRGPRRGSRGAGAGRWPRQGCRARGVRWGGRLGGQQVGRRRDARRCSGRRLGASSTGRRSSSCSSTCPPTGSAARSPPRSS